MSTGGNLEAMEDAGESNEETKASMPEQLEENKDGFVIVDNTYLDDVSELHPLSNLSDFTRVNPVTAQTDFKHLASMPSTFLIGP